MRRLVCASVLLLLALSLGMGGCNSGRDDDDLEITTEALPDGIVGVMYRFELSVRGDDDEFLIIAGNLPPGISFSDDGELFGTPTQAGTFAFTVEVLDLFRGFINARTSKGFAIVVRESG